MATTKELRRFKRMPVYVVEDHCHVLPFIYRNIGAKYLPLEGNVLIHFDSHPDLLLDKNLPEAVCWEKQQLFESLSIENWILPGCYTGQFSQVFWVKPPWTKQIPDGNHNVIIGKHEEKVRIGTPLFYFISDGLFVDKEKLQNRREFQLGVFELPFIPKCEKFILDIDLDYFSTQNPFLSLFQTGNLMKLVDEMFTLKYDLAVDRSYREFVELGNLRNERLEQLEALFSHMEKNPTLDNFNKEIPEKLRKEMENVIRIVDLHYDAANFDWQLLLNAGMTCDMIPLPHHVSSKDEIETMMVEFETFLQKLPSAPVIVTIARSSDDDYCPKNQVDMIQSLVLKILERLYGDIDVKINYDEEIGCCLPDGSDC